MLITVDRGNAAQRSERCQEKKNFKQKRKRSKAEAAKRKSDIQADVENISSKIDSECSGELNKEKNKTKHTTLDLSKIVLEEMKKIKSSKETDCLLRDSKQTRATSNTKKNGTKRKEGLSLEDIICQEVFKSLSAKQMAPSPRRMEIQCNGKIEKETLKSVIEKGTSANFHICTCKFTGEQTTSILEFPSKKKAKEALQRLKVANIQFRLMSDIEYLSERRTQEKQRESGYVEMTARKLLKMHNDKMKDVERQIGTIKGNRHSDLSVIGQLETLESKFVELESQKREFVRFLNTVLNEYKELDTEVQEHQYRSKIERLRQEVKLEVSKFSTALPMYAKRSEILNCVEKNQVCVILGETGSGKSTQMTQYLAGAEFLKDGLIICTQPRKVAAVTLAHRVSEEMGTSVGGGVGYRVGSKEKRTKDTKIMYVTDHVLLNECLNDGSLSHYSCIIIDEAHERSISTDLLLGMIKRAINTRKDLRVVITSATIDPEVFVKYFNGCPVLKVSGRTFPVDVIYEEGSIGLEDYLVRAVDKVNWIHRNRPAGDILVFLTSPKETEKASELTEKRIPSTDLCCVQLHSQQTLSDQQKVLRGSSNGQKRKVVFATNCAETSVTVPGIKYVVDTGLSKEKLFDSEKNVSLLKMCNISRSSADQRKGRAGRMTSGECYRLYNEATYNGMRSVSTPEILRAHLGMSVLKLMLLGISDPMEFDFVQAPPVEAFRTAQRNLEELGAVGGKGLTDLGRKLAQLSLEPRIGKLVLDGIEKGIGTEAVMVAALAGVGFNVFFRGKTKKEQEKSDKCKMKLSENRGDVFTALEVFKEWSNVPEKQKAAWCVSNSLNGRWLRTARNDMRELLKLLDRELKLKVKYELADSSKVEECLASIICSCFSSNICLYLGHRRIGYLPLANINEAIPIHPSSVISYNRSEPQWVVFGNVLHTSRQFLINVTALTEEEAMSEIERRGLVDRLEEMRAITVRRCVIPGIGPHVKTELVKKTYGTIRNLEEVVSDKFNGARHAFDYQGDSLVLYAERERHNEIVSFIQSEAEPIRNKLKLACHENEILMNSGVRCLIIAGGILKAILMPNDSRTLLIRNVREGVSDDEIRECLRRFGEIETMSPKKKKGQSSCWGIVTYSNSSSARDASTHIGKDQFGFSVSLCDPQKEVEQYRVKLSWCRRPLLGFGFVLFGNPYEARTVNVNTITVKDQNVEVKLNIKNCSELYLTKLPPDASAEEIKEAFLEHGVHIDDLRLPRKKAFVTSNQDVEMYKRRLNMHLNQIGIEDKYEVNLFKPKDKDFIMKGNITCSSLETANEIAEQHMSILVDGHNSKVNAKLEFHFSEFVRKEIYDVVHSDLQDLYLSLQLERAITAVRSEEERNGCFRFRITASDLETLQACRKRINYLLDPEQKTISDQDERRLLMSGKGDEMLSKIMKNESVYIHFDQRRSTLSIYGNALRKTAASNAVEDFLKESNKYKLRAIQLAGKGIPVGMLRALFRRFDVNLEKLKKDSDLINVYVKIHDHVLHVWGSSEALAKCDDILQAVMRTLRSEVRINKEVNDDEDDDEEEACPVCFCMVDDDSYRTEYCAHAYCKQCIRGLVHHAIKSKELPIRCVKESCGEPLVVEDVFNLVGWSHEDLEALTAAATERFVLENDDRYSYCVGPDCPIVYKTTRTKHRFRCPNPNCQVEICTNCKEKYHEGLSCAMYQGLKSDPDFDVKAWMKESPETRRLCPQCGCCIEKNYGCMHMQCRCGAHFCWRCQTVFPTGQAVYNHQSSCRGHP